MRDYEARCRVLEDELEEARERIAFLEETLGVRCEVPVCLGLTTSEARILGVIIKRPLATKEAVIVGLYGGRNDSDGIPDPKIADVLVCKMRPKLEKFGFEIETVWGQGWRMSTEHKQSIQTLLQQEGLANA